MRFMFYLPIWSENYLHYLSLQVVRKYHRFWCHFWCHHGCTGEVSMVGQCVYVQIQFFWKGPVECTETSGTKLWRFSVWLCMERSQKQLFRNLQRYANGLPFYHDFASKLELMFFCTGWRLLLHIQCNSTQGKSCQSRVNTIIYVPIYPCATNWIIIFSISYRTGDSSSLFEDYDDYEYTDGDDYENPSGNTCPTSLLAKSNEDIIAACSIKGSKKIIISS